MVQVGMCCYISKYGIYPAPFDLFEHTWMGLGSLNVKVHTECDAKELNVMLQVGMCHYMTK